MAEEAEKIEGVKLARAVTGQFDVVIYAELEKVYYDLAVVINKLQTIEGVLKSQTLIAMPPSADMLPEEE
ncbi:hypothetical protein KAS14_06975 [Candidatus Bathyarchaeota archaeon]|nr:hypothetical protein [Candidatus Bathyarchaeota archaeon]